MEASEMNFKMKGLDNDSKSYLKKLFFYSIIGIAFSNGANEIISFNGFISGISLKAHWLQTFLGFTIIYYAFISLISSFSSSPFLNVHGEDEVTWTYRQRTSGDITGANAPFVRRQPKRIKFAKGLLIFIEVFSPVLLGLVSINHLTNWTPQNYSKTNIVKCSKINVPDMSCIVMEKPE